MVWQSAGYLAGLGIRKAVVTSADKAKLRAAMNPSGADVPHPVLDIERYITDNYYFQLGVPWGWRDMHQYEIDQARGQNGLTVVAGCVAERTDGAWTGVAFSPFPVEGPALAQMLMQPEEMHRLRFARVPNGRPLGSPRKILIGGEIGLIFHYGHDENGAMRGQPSAPFVAVSTTECYFTRYGQMFQMEFNADSVWHERYWPCLLTMLGSWRWLT